MPTLVITKNYADNTVLTQLQLNQAMDSISDFVNNTKLDDENIQSGSISNGLLAANSVATSNIQVSAITLARLASEVSERLMPAGGVIAYGGDVIPNGYLYCDGTAVSRTAFSALFTAIGVKHGQGDASTTFNLPDYRGRFLRGFDNGAARDPDASSRTAAALGGATGDSVGSVQIAKTAFPVDVAFTFSGTTTGQSQSHGHSITTTNFAGNGGNAKVAGSSGNTGDLTAGQTSGANADHTHNYSGTVAGGDAETRPLNANVRYLIKY